MDLLPAFRADKDREVTHGDNGEKDEQGFAHLGETDGSLESQEADETIDGHLQYSQPLFFEGNYYAYDQKLPSFLGFEDDALSITQPTRPTRDGHATGKSAFHKWYRWNKYCATLPATVPRGGHEVGKGHRRGQSSTGVRRVCSTAKRAILIPASVSLLSGLCEWDVV